MSTALYISTYISTIFTKIGEYNYFCIDAPQAGHLHRQVIATGWPSPQAGHLHRLVTSTCWSSVFISQTVLC